jgi:integrase
MPRAKKSNRSDGRYEIKRTVGQDINGNAIRRSFYGENKAEAEKRYQEYLAGINERENKKKNMPFADWVDTWLYSYKQPDVKATTFITTYERPCKNYILKHFDGVFIQDISQVHVKNFLNTLSEKSQSLLDKIVICLRGIFETAINNDIIAKNPCHHITVKSKAEKVKKRTYDSASVDALCATNNKYSIFVHILLRTGLRCSEMCGLRWSDIDLDAGIINVRESLVTEGALRITGAPKSENSIRRLPIPEDLSDRLKRAAAERTDNSDFFAILNGKRLTPNHFGDRQMEAFYNAAGVPKEQRLAPHELRHTCGTLLYQTTKDIYYVSRFLGHSDIGITTKIYVHSEMQDNAIHINFL